MTSEHVAFANRRHRTGSQQADVHERRDRRRAAHRVGDEPTLALETTKCRLGLGSENAVFASGVEPERVEAALEFAHIVAAQHRGVHIEETVAEHVATLDQRTPGFVSADSVDAHSAPSLEIAYGGERLFSEAAIQSDGIATIRETLLEVAHGVAAIADAQKSVGRAQTMNLK